jgi:uncharacterized protein YndB with AHSA1/START domain
MRLRLLLWAGLALALAASRAGAEPTPSPGERRELVRREVVFRSGAAPRDGVPVPGARGGTAFVQVAAPPAAVWTILSQPARYPEIFPGLRAVEVLEAVPDAWLLRTEGKVGPFEFRYHTRYRVAAAAHTLTWRLDPAQDNDVFADHWGAWQLVSEADGTLVVYTVGSVPSSWQPLAGFFERRGIIRALGALRDAAERASGRARGPAPRDRELPGPARAPAPRAAPGPG